MSWARCKELRRRAITSNANLSSLVQGAMTPRSIAPRATGGALFTKTTDAFARESNSVNRTCIHRKGANLRVALQHNTSPSRPVVDPAPGQDGGFRNLQSTDDLRRHLWLQRPDPKQGRSGEGQVLAIDPHRHQAHPALLDYASGRPRLAARRQPGLAGAQGRMAGEGQLPLRREDPHPVVGTRVGRRQEEGGLLHVRPVCEGGHL